MNIDQTPNEAEMPPETDLEQIEVTVDQFQTQESSLLSLSDLKERAGNIARALMLSSALAAGAAGCGKNESAGASDLESVWTNELTPEQDHAVRIVGALSTFEGSNRSKILGLKTDEMIKDYMNTHSLSEEEAGQNLAAAFAKLADHGGDKDGYLDPEEEEWLETVRQNKPGIYILSHKFSKQFKLETGFTMDSGNLDTSAY